MQPLIVRTADVAARPWKNGGGTTRELLARPAGDDWQVRVSVADDKGAHPVKTLSGAMLIAKNDNGKLTLTDENGGVATVTIADVKQSNGVIHVIDHVLLPK